jgi:hypothetical protein
MLVYPAVAMCLGKINPLVEVGQAEDKINRIKL